MMAGSKHVEPLSNNEMVGNHRLEPHTAYIRIRVWSESVEVHYRIKVTTPMIKLKKAYANFIGNPPHTVRFRFNGFFIQNHHTALSLGLVDNDMLVLVDRGAIVWARS